MNYSRISTRALLLSIATGRIYRRAASCQNESTLTRSMQAAGAHSYKCAVFSSENDRPRHNKRMRVQQEKISFVQRKRIISVQQKAKGAVWPPRQKNSRNHWRLLPNSRRRTVP